MAQSQQKQGFPPVPLMKDMPLSRFLGGVRNTLLELQSLTSFFSSLNDNQQSALLDALGKLVKNDTKQRKQIKDLEGLVEENQEKIAQLEFTISSMQTQISNLQDQVNEDTPPTNPEGES